MRKVAISNEELNFKVLAAVQAHRGCEPVKEIAITPVHRIGFGMTWHPSLIDSGSADPQLAASVLRQTRDQLEPAFEIGCAQVAEEKSRERQRGGLPP